MRPLPIILGIFVALLLLSPWWLGASEQVLLLWIKTHLELLRALAVQHPVLFPLSYLAAYALLTSFLPLGIPLMLLGGAVFPFLLGSLLVCTGYSIGATLNFLLSRYWMGGRCHPRLVPLRDLIERGGWMTLFALRLIPLLPAQGISFAMGATRLSVPVFFTATWTGDLPLSAFLVFMGRRLSTIEHTHDLLSADILLAFTGFGLLLALGKWWLGRRGGLAAANETTTTQ